MTHQCYFCQSELALRYPDTYVCRKCPLDIMHDFSRQNNELRTIWFLTDMDDIGDIRYEIDLHFLKNKSDIFRSSRLSSRPTFTFIKSFDYILPITPHNVQQKLKTILTFL
jgi:hypothetical protein